MPEIQKPPNLCFLKITQKRIESQNIYRNNVFGHIIRLARTCLVNSSLFVSVSWLDKPARLSFSCSLDLLLISIKQIWIEISETAIGCLAEMAFCRARRPSLSHPHSLSSLYSVTNKSNMRMDFKINPFRTSKPAVRNKKNTEISDPDVHLIKQV